MTNWKRGLIIFLILIALCSLILTFCYVIGDLNARQVTYNITYKQVDGEVFHGQIYEVMIAPGVDVEQVNDSLKLICNQYGFVIVPYDETRTYPSPWNNPVYKYQFNQWMSDSWYGSEIGVSSNVWSLLRNRWEIDTYLCAR